MNTVTHRKYEQTLIKIARVLPSGRAEQLVDFARFLEAQILREDLIKQESVPEIEADNDKWEALMATDESQALLDKMAVQALAEYDRLLRNL